MKKIFNKLSLRIKMVSTQIFYMSKKIFVFRYMLLLLLFFIWMIFLDTNSFLIHKELNNDIDALESQKKELENKIIMDKKMIDNLKNLDSLEVYGRKTYNLKKENETIFHMTNFDKD
tara:strand:+ start:1197 stop:1547 length:351 start_codon:yes stop_codon:yes gene_type:complete